MQRASSLRLAASLLGTCLRAQRQRVQAFRQLRPQRVIHQPVPCHGRQAVEGVGHDFHAEVRFGVGRAAGVSGVACVQVAFVDHAQLQRPQRCGELPAAVCLLSAQAKLALR